MSSRRPPRHRAPILFGGLLATAMFFAIGGSPAFQPAPPDDSAPAEERGQRGEGRRGPGRGEGREEFREGRAVREIMRLKIWLRRMRGSEEQLTEARTAIASGTQEPTAQVMTPREVELRSELLQIDRERFLAASKVIARKVLERLEQTNRGAEGEPDADSAERSARIAERLAETKAFCEGAVAEDATFEKVAALLDEIGPGSEGVQDAALQRRLSRLESEADSLRERLHAIEEEISLIRGDGPGSVPPWPPPGSMPPPMDEMRERGMFDGRRNPPNHPSNRGGRERGGTTPPQAPDDKPAPKP